MALKPCRECRQQVSTDADKCPHCGVRDPTGAKASMAQKGCLGCLGLLGVLFVIGTFAGGDGGSPGARISSLGLTPDTVASADKWRYTSDTDPMTGRGSATATIASENTVNFDFPYSGAQHATLHLRRHPSYGSDVILQIEKGQILCQSFQDCTVRVRFDDGEAEQWTGRGPGDNSSTTVFIRGYQRFVERLREAEIVRIQIDVFQEGAPIFEFHVGGYNRERHTAG
jgi:hypothetical protein